MAVRAIAQNVIRDAIRQKVLYVTFLVALILFAVVPMLPSAKLGVKVQLFQDIALGVAYLALAILAVALSVNQVPGEVEKKTIYNILSKPVRRGDFLLAKYLGILIVLLISSVLIGSMICGFVFAIFGRVSFGILQGILTIFLEAAMVTAFAILVSTFASPAVNIFACLLFYFIGHVKNDALTLMAKSGGLMERAIQKIFYYLLPSLENFNVNEAVARGLVVRPLFLLELFLYAVAFSVTFLMVASLTLARKEL